MSVINQELILVKLVLYIFTRGCEENVILITVLQDITPRSFGSPLLMWWQNFCLHFRIKHGGSTFFETVGTSLPN